MNIEYTMVDGDGENHVAEAVNHDEIDDKVV